MSAARTAVPLGTTGPNCMGRGWGASAARLHRRRKGLLPLGCSQRRSPRTALQSGSRRVARSRSLAARLPFSVPLILHRFTAAEISAATCDVSGCRSADHLALLNERMTWHVAIATG